MLQDLGQQVQRRREIGAHRLSARGQRGLPAADRQACAQPVERVLDLLPAVLRRAAHQHAAGQPRLALAALDRRLVAVVHRQIEVHRAAAGFFRQQRDLHAIGERVALGTRVEIGRRRVESLAGGNRRIALVVR